MYIGGRLLKKALIYCNLILILSIFLFSNFKSTYESNTFYACDSGSIIFSEELSKGDKILFYFDVKILEETKSNLILYGTNGEEILKWDKPRLINDKNKGEFTVKESGTYSMKIFFMDDSLSKKHAEVEVDWKIIKK